MNRWRKSGKRKAESGKADGGSLHEPDPHPACGHPLPSDPGYAGGFAEASGRGAGGVGSFSVEVHGPNARARHVQVEATHEQTLTRPCGHPLPSDGRGAGGEGSFSVEVHGPNSRAHDVQVKATHEPDLRELETLGLLTPHPGPLPVEGRGSSSWSQCASKMLEVGATHEPFLSRSSRRKEAHSIPGRSSGKRSEPRDLGCYVRFGFMAPMCVRNSEVEATHEPTLR